MMSFLPIDELVNHIEDLIRELLIVLENNDFYCFIRQIYVKFLWLANLCKKKNEEDER